MLKTTMLAAFAAVSMCAFASHRQEIKDWGRDGDSMSTIDPSGKSFWDMKDCILRQDQELTGTDRYTFEAALNRMSSNEESALIKGLFYAHRQAVMLHHDKIVAMLATESNENYAVNPDMTSASVNSDESFRPMRIVMDAPKPHDVDYKTGLDILCSNLTATESTWLENWFDNANDGQKDVVVRMLKCDAKRADEPIYTSIYRHRTGEWAK